jgi:hypothetical protein
VTLGSIFEIKIMIGDQGGLDLLQALDVLNDCRADQ